LEERLFTTVFCHVQFSVAPVEVPAQETLLVVKRGVSLLELANRNGFLLTGVVRGVVGSEHFVNGMRKCATLVFQRIHTGVLPFSAKIIHEEVNISRRLVA
jgi:hypothetical protein